LIGLGRARAEGCRDEQEHHEDREHAGHDRQREEGAELEVEKPEEREGDDRPDDAAEVIHHAVETERVSALVRGHRVGDHRVSRRSAHSLADAIRNAGEDRVRRRRRDREERAREGGQSVPEGDQGFAPGRTIASPPGAELHERCHRLCGPFEPPERRRASPEREKEDG
jgi:hypothetical protein